MADGPFDTLCVAFNRCTSFWQIIPPLQEKKRVLLLLCHPLGSRSFNGAIAQAARRGLEASGHEVRFRSLCGEEEAQKMDDNAKKSQISASSGEFHGGVGFPPALTAREAKGYLTIGKDDKNTAAASGGNGMGMAPEVRQAVADLRWAQALVVVYPTWCMNVPATLKVRL